MLRYPILPPQGHQKSVAHVKGVLYMFLSYKNKTLYTLLFALTILLVIYL